MDNNELDAKRDKRMLKDEVPFDDYAELDEARRKRRRLVRRLIALFCLLSFLGLVLSNFNVFFLEWPSYLSQFNTLSSEELVQRSRPAVVRMEAYSSGAISSMTPRSGTGFNIDARGLIITNQHVVNNSQEVRVFFPDGRSFSSNQMRIIQGFDLALVKLNTENLPVLEVNFGKYPAPGDVLNIIGNPEGYQGIPSQGVLNNYVNIDGNRSALMLINANIGHGNSGSPVLDKQGRVVGVVFAMTGEDENNQALAIPLAELSSELLW